MRLSRCTRRCSESIVTPLAMIMSNWPALCTRSHDEALTVLEETLATFTRALGIDKIENPKVLGEKFLKYFSQAGRLGLPMRR
jgi:hypothetical protein